MADKVGGILARLGAAVGVSISADIAAVKVDTADVRTDVTALHDTDVPAIKAETALIVADTDVLQQEWAKRNVSQVAQTNVANNTYADIVNISDKGVITGMMGYIYSFTDVGNVEFIITIDGVAIITEIFLYFSATGQANSLSFNHRFNTDLRVQIRISAVDKGGFRGLVAYTKDA